MDSPFKAREKFLDRVEQSFMIFRKHGLQFGAAFFIFQIIGAVILPEIFFFVFDSIVPLESIANEQNTPYIGLLITGAISVGILYFVTYLLLIIPFQISLLKGIKDSLEQKEIDISQNIIYGFKMLGSAFKVYWYIFQYIFLIPALVLIVIGFGIIAVLLGVEKNTLFMYTKDAYENYITIIYVGGIFFILLTVGFFFIYRGVKTSFSLIHVFETGDFSKKAFRTSLSLTRNKWWRIVGNLVAVGFLGGLLLGIVTQLLGSISFATQDTSFLSQIDFSKPIDWKNLLSTLDQNNSVNSLKKLIEAILSCVLTIFITVFSYILYLRLVQEQDKNLRETLLGEEKIREL